MFPPSQLQQMQHPGRDTGRGQQIFKPKSVSSRTGGAAAAPRRALGDITNATNKSQAGLGKKAAFGLASAAPQYQTAPSSIMPSSEDSSRGRMEESPSSEVEDMMLSLDLATEVNEVEDYMNVEEVREEELGIITDDLQEMSIKMHSQDLPSGVSDIDRDDADNPLAVTEYVNQQYEYYREKECRPGYDPNYMSKQPYINARMRTILIDWLVEVHWRLKGEPETLYLCINILDRFLDRKQVPKNKLQLVGVTAYLIAAKYEEIYPPEVKELVYMVDNAYDQKQILDMESRVLTTLKFNITVCTAYCFLVRFLKASHADNRMFFLASFICERTLQELDTLHFLPSMVAASAIYLARKNLHMRPWSATLVHYTRYTEETLLPCLRVISPWITSRSTSQVAVKNKYSGSKYMKVASAELVGLI